MSGDFRTETWKWTGAKCGMSVERLLVTLGNQGINIRRLYQKVGFSLQFYPSIADRSKG
jgi:hypothetical protein